MSPNGTFCLTRASYRSIRHRGGFSISPGRRNSMKLTSQVLAACALAVASVPTFAQVNLPADTSNTAVASVDAAHQGRHTSTETADGIFWPPNHKLRTVTIYAENDDGDECDVTITAVQQDEPVDGIGDGSTSPDAA